MNRELVVMQDNVHRGGAIMDSALHIGFEARADVIMLQEPYYNEKSGRTKTHPGYKTFVQPGFSNCRAITFVRKGLAAHIPHTRGIAEVVDVYIPKHDTTIINVYRPPGLMRGSRIHTCITNIEIRG